MAAPGRIPTVAAATRAGLRARRMGAGRLVGLIVLSARGPPVDPGGLANPRLGRFIPSRAMFARPCTARALLLIKSLGLVSAVRVSRVVRRSGPPTPCRALDGRTGAGQQARPQTINGGPAVDSASHPASAFARSIAARRV